MLRWNYTLLATDNTAYKFYDTYIQDYLQGYVHSIQVAALKTRVDNVVVAIVIEHRSHLSLDSLVNNMVVWQLGPLSLKLINFDPSLDK